MEQKSVLITGGSGLVGRYLTSLLLSKGYKVSHLSRSGKKQDMTTVFKWDPGKRIIDPAALNGVEYIVHLAGVNIGEQRWTKKRKDEIVRSRVDSAKLLFNTVSENGIRLKAFVSASAVGYYGSVTSEKTFTEDDPPGKDFLGNTCRLSEEAADLFEKDGIRTVKIRTAVVLEKNDSALSKLMGPARFGFVIRTGTGQQYMPWIHISDLCNVYLKAIEDKNINGPYNAVSPEHVNHNDFVRAMAIAMKKPVLLPPVPAFIIRTAMGEMSDVILKGSRVSSEKIIAAGYKYLHPLIQEALSDIINPPTSPQSASRQP
jgi:uncharacterized protein (TIGR01777 family)